ncbi:MAG: Type I Iterative PKS [Cirrosporium novae-zelandiae]|nr:MAG: Type I Iterative PKS [Cirrosporium novae-zelandiae]
MPYLGSSGSSGISTPATETIRNGQDVAIIGLACRLPGDATDAEAFWELLCSARSAYSDTDRFNADGFQDNGTGKLNSSATRGGHFLRQNVAAFDASFFSISRNEALAIDPQQRIMLEVAYEAFENAGVPIEAVAGSQTGCFVGNFTTDYREMLFKDPEAAPLYTVTGTGSSLVSNRVSWFYDLKGPSFTVNTACSSSLVALHSACQSLQSGESSMAIVGGSNLILSPEMFMFFTNQNFLSKDGLCKSFDASGNGYSRGDGVAAIILKPVDDAIRDGDPIRAIIRGTGVNQNGKNKGITLPSAQAQADLIRSTYQSAGLDFKDTNFVEAHGTGTKAGDPLELEAMAKTLTTVRGPQNKLIVGSAKANIGHTEATAGLAGVIKGIYMLENGIIPPNIHFHKGNPAIPFDEWKMMIPTKLMPWPTSGIRRLSVNSFGYSGTNAHAILDDAFSYLKARRLKGVHFTRPSTSTSSRGLPRSTGSLWMPATNRLDSIKTNGLKSRMMTRLFVLSAQDQDGINRQKESFAKYFRGLSLQSESAKDKDEYLRDLAFTLSEKRSRLSWKSYVTASSLEELSSKLEDKHSDSLTCRSIHEPRVGFIFTGQGAQWAKMGIELCQYSVFRKSVEQADEYLRSNLGCTWSTVQELHCEESDSNINLPTYSQPICTILQVALVDLLESWNITPCAMAGHSSGEIAGAYCLGALSKEDAWKIAYYRGLLSSQMHAHSPGLEGAMMAVGASEFEAENWISRVTRGKVVVACVNSPSSVTISGDAPGIEELHAMLKKEDIFARKLKVETAYHSHHMNMIAAPYLQAIHDIQPMPARGSRKMYSAVSGGLADATELGPVNWVRNLVSPVQFSDAVYELLRPIKLGKRTTETAVDILLEVGPHSALQGPVKQIMKEYGISGVDYRSVLLRGRNGINTALDAAGALFANGVGVDISKVNSGTGYALNDVPSPLVNLPSYRWNHSRTYWGESRIAKQYRTREHPQLSLLGAPCPTMGENERLWRGFLRMSEEQWVKDHKIQSSVLYPAAGYIAMAIEAACQIAEKGRVVRDFRLRDIQINAAAMVTEDCDLECVFQFRPHLIATRDKSSTWLEFTVSTCADGQDLRQNCSGLLLVEYESQDGSAMSIERQLGDQAAKDQYYQAEEVCETSEDPQEFYKELASLGLVYGPAFQKISRIRKGTGKSCCVVETFNPEVPISADRPHIIHPATLDAMFHAVFAAFKGDGGLLKEAMVPKSIDEVIVSAQAPYENGTRFKGFSDAEKHGFRELMADLVMLDEKTMKPSVTVKGFCCAAVSGMGDPTDEASEETAKSFCSKLVWTPALELLSSDQERQLINAAAPGDLSPEMARKIEESELMAFIFIRRAIENVSLDMVPTEPLKALYEWMQEQLALASIHAHPLQAVMEDWQSTDKETEEALEKEVEADGTEGEALCRVGRNLEKVLCGEVDPMQLLADKDLLDGGFVDMKGMKECLTKISELVNLMANIRPGLSILEIGTGNGGVAPAVLSSLSKFLDGVTKPIEYTFSCSNAATLQKAEGHLQEFKDRVKFKVLDFEKNPADQGFENGTYDIILTCNAIVAVQNLEQALHRTQKLLKPGGKFCALKVTDPGLRLGMTLGCLPNWWAKEQAGRLHGLVDIQAREALLRNKKFDFGFIERDFEDWRYQQLSLIISTVEESQKPTPHSDEVVILEAPGMSPNVKALSSQLVSELKHRSVTINKVAWGNDLSLLKDKRCISLLELEKPVLSSLSATDFATIQSLILECSSLLWISSSGDPSGSLASGMARSIRNEIPDMQFRTLQIQPKSLDSPNLLAPAIARLATISTADDEFIEEDGILKVSRVIEDTPMNKHMSSSLSEGTEIIESMSLKQSNSPQKLAIQNQGMLDTLCYEADEVPSQPLGDDDVEIKVKATGLNFRDIMVAMGHIPDSLLGFEASGVIARIGSNVTKFKVGDHVCTLGHGAHRSVFRNNEAFVQLVPEGLSFEEASTLPLVHCTAYNALVRIARAEPGQTVLIHAAAGGVGQVAIQIAKHIGMEIFATVGSPDKRKLIQDVYGIPDDHIFASRDVSFAKGVMRMTHGRGVDVVLNSLSGEALRQTWNCIAPFGTFIEIGMKDILGNTGLDMRPFLQDATFAFFNLSHVLRANPKLMERIIQGAFDFLRQGITKPVSPLTVYPISQVENAFRLMQTGKHRGKIALSWDENEVVPIVRTVGDSLKLDSNATYVLVGGLGGLGRSLANLFVDHGARYLCFISRSGDTSKQAQKLVQDLEKRQVFVRVYRCDIADEESLAETIIQCSQELPPIRGMVQCAMVLRDVLFEKMTYQQWTESLRPKVDGSWNLHSLLPEDLDFFIILSSFAGIFGNRSQSNYAAAGAYEDALAHYRHSQGLKAVTLDLGVMRDVGVIAEQGATDYLKEWEEPFGIRELELHDLIKKTITSQAADDGDIPPQILTGFATGGAAHAASIRRPLYFDDARFSILAKTGLGAAQSSGAASGSKSISLQDQLAHAESLADATAVVIEALVNKVAKSLQTSPSEIDPARPLHSYGVDSLVAVEIRTWIFKDLKSNVSLFDVLSAVPISALAEKIAGVSKLLAEGVAGK